jgi:hypothetical protein
LKELTTAAHAMRGQFYFVFIGAQHSRFLGSCSCFCLGLLTNLMVRFDSILNFFGLTHHDLPAFGIFKEGDLSKFRIDDVITSKNIINMLKNYDAGLLIVCCDEISD